jgi:hypothetical protein
MAKKKTQSEAEELGGKIIEKPNHYGIDAEIGLLGIHTYELKEGSKKIFSTEGDVFPETGSREHYKTVCFREVVVFSACDESFRKSASQINRVWWRQEKTDQVQSRTIANVVEREGEQMQAHLRTKAKHILEDYGFTADGSLSDPKKAFASIKKEDVTLSREVVCHMIEELNRGQEKEKHIDISELHETFEDPSAIKANISIDDVCCKKQKASGRKRGSPPKEKREMVYNTVAHIQNKESKTYTLNTPTISQMMLIALAFLLANELMNLPGSLVFFTDGARDLRSSIQDIFRFIPFKIILDWFHLKKKCKDLLSMAINGKQVKNQILTALLAWLWLGKVHRAIKVLQDLSQDQIKNNKELKNLINYLDRNSSCIPCYALRKRLSLRISSNPVEKANDLVVSSRQKHNGMSWSADGSTSLATLTSVRRNDEHLNWLRHRY